MISNFYSTYDIYMNYDFVTTNKVKGDKMMWKKKKFRGLSLLLTLILLLTFSMNVFASDKTGNVEEEQIVFKDLNINPVQEYTGINERGEAYTIKIEPSTTRATNAWKISYTAVLFNCWFTVQLTNNKVTTVWDEGYTTIGCNVTSESLTKTSTYGQYRLGVQSWDGVISFSGYLRATATGSGNDVTVSNTF